MYKENWDEPNQAFQNLNLEEQPSCSNANMRGYPSNANMRGFPSNASMRGFPSNSNKRGFPSNASVRGFPSNASMRGFPSNTNMRGFPSNTNMRGFPSKTNMRGFPSNANMRGYPSWSSGNRGRGGHFQARNQSRSNRFCKTVMKVEATKIGRLIGRQGIKIKELQDKTGARVKIGDYCPDDKNCKIVIISGEEKSQKICQKLIEELVGRPHRSGHDEAKGSAVDWDLLNALSDKAEAERWSKYPPLKRNFYIEAPEIAMMTKEEVEAFRKQCNNIVVKNIFGGNEAIPNPVKTFEQAFRYYPRILQEIRKQGFRRPSPIQCQAWPILLSGRDLIGIAQTGTGKTLAFLLPALVHIDGQKVPRSARGGANVLIIAPTRELALQIEREVHKYSYKGIKSVCVYGGGSRSEQMRTVHMGVEIIIATPGRLSDLVEARVINLNSITYLVLDEADRMLDMGFEPQIRKVILDIRPDRQAVMTSATWPFRVQALAQKYMRNPIQVYIGSLDLTAVHSVIQTVLVVKEEDKRAYLFQYLKNVSKTEKILVFVSKKVVADHLSCDLALERVLCQSIHGDREQVDREQALEEFQTGEVRILIATDVASRGLDISDITKVFNYDFPRNIEEYVHRVGRTGRAGKTGEAITLFTRSDWSYARELITIMEEAKQPVPEELYEMRERYLNMLQRKRAEKLFLRGGGRRRFNPGSNGFGFYHSP